MSLIKKSLILAVSLFIFQLALSALFYPPSTWYNGFIGGAAYLFIFGFWIYVCFAMAYVYAVKGAKSWSTKYLVATVLTLFGYFLSNIGNIIDDQFIDNFNLGVTLGFVLYIPILIYVEQALSMRKRSDND